MMTNDEIVFKTKEEFMLRGLSENTLESYLLVLQSFTRFYVDQPIESMGEREIRRYLLHLIELNMSSGTVNINNSALRFIHGVVLERNISLDTKTTPIP